MFYDVLIFASAAVGIAGVFVYSYKISHSRVYVVGIVREKAAALNQTVKREQDAEDLPASAVLGVPSAIAIEIREAKKPRCERCGRLQDFSENRSRCRHCGHAFSLEVASENEQPSETESRLETIQAEQSYSLKKHEKLFMDFDKRIRQLERESLVQSLPKIEDNRKQYEPLESVQ